MKNLLLIFPFLITTGLFAQNDSCVNINFEYGDFTGWELYHGEVTANPFEMINIVNDTIPTAQHVIVTGGNDSVVGVGLPKVYPWEGNASLQLGDVIGAGYGAARVQQTLLVDSVDNAFAYHYALVMEDPSNHTHGEMPFFTARVITQSGDTVHSNEVMPLDPSSGGDPDFVPYGGGVGFYLPWKTKYVDLSSYVGEYVTVEFTTGDCGQGGHYGYAYLDADCLTPSVECMFTDFEFNNVLPLKCSVSGNVDVNILGGDPPFNYSWSSGDTTSSISPTTPGLYSLTLTDSSGCDKTKTVLVNGFDYPLGYDLRTYLKTNSFRAGQESWIRVGALNDGCSTVIGQIKLVIDNRVTLTSAYPSPDLISGDTIIWNTDSLNYDSASFSPYIYVETDVSVNTGDLLCFNVELTPISGDIDTTNNTRTLCKNVVNSYDPNFKTVYPQGECDENYVLIDQKLTYSVHFQNTGTASAINIYVLDTLHSDLDINTVRVLSQSHEGLITEVVNGNTLKFIYDNINLPDSTSNEQASHGYVIFEVDPISTIPHQTKVENRVGIYFDYNAPIITNTVFNTFVDSIPHQQTILNEISATNYDLNGVIYDSSGTYYQELYSAEGCDSLVILNLTITPTSISDNVNEEQIRFYPNPINNLLKVIVPLGIKDYKIAIYNVTGQIVYEGVNTTSINTAHFSKGVYYIKLWSEEKLTVVRIIKK